jgi:N-methylhydantoinase B
VILEFPGGAGYGDAKTRDAEQVKTDLARGYISAKTAAQTYGLSDADIAAVQTAVTKGDVDT